MKTVNGVHGAYRVLTPPINKGGIGSIYKTSDPAFVYKEYHSAAKAGPTRQALRCGGGRPRVPTAFAIGFASFLRRAYALCEHAR